MVSGQVEYSSPESFNSLPARYYLTSADKLCKQFVSRSVWPDLDQNCLTLSNGILEIIF